MATFLKNINMVARSATLYLDKRLMEVSGLKGYHGKYILGICNNPGISQEALARRLFVNKSNVARQIAVLEEEGYVERRQGEDKRVSLIFPTKKAEEILPKIREVNTEWRETICYNFTEEEKQTLVNLTARLYENAVKFMEEQGD